LSGLFYLLITNPHVLRKLEKEIRTAFTSPADMTFANAAKLSYMDACLSEALRMYPPVPSSINRFIAPEGNTINGRFVPPGVN